MYLQWLPARGVVVRETTAYWRCNSWAVRPKSILFHLIKSWNVFDGYGWHQLRLIDIHLIKAAPSVHQLYMNAPPVVLLIMEMSFPSLYDSIDWITVVFFLPSEYSRLKFKIDYFNHTVNTLEKFYMICILVLPKIISLLFQKWCTSYVPSKSRTIILIGCGIAIFNASRLKHITVL